ncbi:Proton-dependent oligopeptide transporter family, partial [Dillenia turbinata]
VTAFENVAFIALAVNLITYFTGVMHYGMADAAAQLTNRMGTCYLQTVFVAAFRNGSLGLLENSVDLYEIDRDKETALEIEFLPHTDDLSRELFYKQVVSKAKDLLYHKLYSLFNLFSPNIFQLQTFSVQQGTTMDTRLTNSFHIPTASLPIFPIAFLLIMMPAYDRICVLFLRKIIRIPTGITRLQRTGAGVVVSSLSMAAAALAEVKRKHVARENNMLDAIPVAAIAHMCFLASTPILHLWNC